MDGWGERVSSLLLTIHNGKTTGYEQEATAAAVGIVVPHS